MEYVIQIIHRKKDDVLAQYILEFFKFAGYIVSTYVETELLKRGKYNSAWADYSKSGGRSLRAEYTILLCLDKTDYEDIPEDKDTTMWSRWIKLKEKKKENLADEVTTNSGESAEKVDEVGIVEIPDKVIIIESSFVAKIEETSLRTNRDSEIEWDEAVSDQEKDYYGIMLTILERLENDEYGRIEKSGLSEKKMSQRKNRVKSRYAILRILHEKFSKYGLFFYFYNDGLLKFIEPVTLGRERHELETAIKRVRDVSFDIYVDCLKEILKEFKENEKDVCVLHAYSFLENKLNEIERRKCESYLFKPEVLANRLTAIKKLKDDKLDKSNNEFVTQRDNGEWPQVSLRNYYLAANIYRNNPALMGRTKFYLEMVRDLYTNSKTSGNDALHHDDAMYQEECMHFIYYQKGRYYESIGNLKEAKKYYRKAARIDPFDYRARYKLASMASESSEDKEEWKEGTSVEKWEELKTTLLNGYGPNQVMPKKRIIAYRACKRRAKLLLEQGYRDNAQYDNEVALKCAEFPGRNGSPIEEDALNIYKLYSGEKRVCYGTILKYCMPINENWRRDRDIATKVLRTVK